MPFSSLSFWQMESINVAGVLQEAGDADSGPVVDRKCKLNVSSFLTLPDLLDCLIYFYQEFCVHHIVIMNDGGMGYMGGG